MTNATKPTAVLEFNFDAALHTDVGQRRKNNQDFGAIRPDLGLFLVADGMGGHSGGEVASQLCAETIVAFIAEAYEKQDYQPIDDPTLLDRAIQKANLALIEKAKDSPELKGMGTTVTAIKISGKTATIAQVGDSRCYYFSHHGIWQMTRDHSLVQEKLRAGLIKRDQVKSDEMRNVITRSVGYDATLRVDLYSFSVEPGDGFLLCSDGLSGPLEEFEIFDILEINRKEKQPANMATKNLVDLANKKGGDDNITAVMVRCNSTGKT